MKSAPLWNDLAEGPEGGRAFWLTADDDVRLRAAHWPGGDKGTVFMLPGRSEYVEKYGRAAGSMAGRGYTPVTIDWRGQGLAQRLLANPLIGHVDRFTDYQRDVKALMGMVRGLGLPEPWYMIAHSMGGAIGLRALQDGMPFRSTAFSGPMWGIAARPALRPLSWASSTLGTAAGLGARRVPTTARQTYVLSVPFEGNMLTSDPEMWDYMVRQTAGIDGVALAGPSLRWLYEALRECRRFHRRGPSPHRIVTFMGSNERIVTQAAVTRLMDRWTNGELVICEGAEHEIVMERPAVRNRFFDAAAALFDDT